MDVEYYLNNVKISLRLQLSTKGDTLRELETHFSDRIQEFKEAGLTEEQAAEQAIKRFGPARKIAAQLGEVYSQGSWRQALLAALPHGIVALLFALRVWHSITWLTLAWVFVTIGAMAVTIIHAWRNGKPAWMFPWLGYGFFPVILVGFLLLYLPAGWLWPAALVYVPLALFTLISVASKTLVEDWLYISVMMLPLPVVLGWVLALDWHRDLYGIEHQVQELASWVALSFLVLAMTVAMFIRVKQRWLKAWALLALDALVLIVTAVISRGTIHFWLWLALVLLSALLLFAPAWLERLVVNGKFHCKISPPERLQEQLNASAIRSISRIDQLRMRR